MLCLLCDGKVHCVAQQDALALLTNIARRGLQPDAVTFTTLLSIPANRTSGEDTSIKTGAMWEAATSGTIDAVSPRHEQTDPAVRV
jgi:hypothetical protein